MPDKTFITPQGVLRAAHRAVSKYTINSDSLIYGIPRGGVSAALAVAGITGAKLVDGADFADLILDDIYDSGATYERYRVNYPHARFGWLFDKREPEYAGRWLVMPWEVEEAGHDESATDAVRRLLQYVGEDPAREGLKETPRRVLEALHGEWCSGYGVDPAEVLKTFEDGAVDEMVVIKDIPVYSLCEHHMAPMWGRAVVGYVPNGRIVGLSKVVRLVNIFAKRLQVQERLTSQIAEALMEPPLSARGAGVILECRHMCMESRGVRVAGSVTSTSALRGVLFDDARARSEFLALR